MTRRDRTRSVACAGCALAGCALLAALPSCKGRSPNWIRAALPLAGEAWGPDDPVAEGGAAVAFHDLHVHVVEADGQEIRHWSLREDGLEGEYGPIEGLTGDGALWEPGAGRLAVVGVTDTEGRQVVREFIDCVEQGPVEDERWLAVRRGALVRAPGGGGWLLAVSAVRRVRCEGAGEVTLSLDHLVLVDDDWELRGPAALVRAGPEARVTRPLDAGGEPALAWASDAEIAVGREDGTRILGSAEGKHTPILEPTDGGLAVITRPGGDLRVRLFEAAGGEMETGPDVGISPGHAPTSVAAAWTGDRLGVFFAVERAQGTGTIQQHILVEVFPDGKVGAPIKVYAQQSLAEDAARTRHLVARWTQDRYGLAWVADDGESQDLLVEEVLPGGGQGERQAWRLDPGEGWRRLVGLDLFPTPPQYLIHTLEKCGAGQHRHRFVLTALPGRR